MRESRALSDSRRTCLNGQIAWRRSTRASQFNIATLAVVMVIFGPRFVQGASAPRTVPLSYARTFADRAGVSRPVSFDGQASGRTLAGTLRIDGVPYAVTATIGDDGSVSGKLVDGGGKRFGVFWAQRDGRRGLTGSFDLNGEVGEWTVPLQVPLP